MQNPYETLGVSEDAGSEAVHEAYRALARKWHPDRFAEGPERAWAEQRMIEINRAYNALASRISPQVASAPSGRFSEIKLLIDAGQLSRARQLLRAMSERDAEWNYHFGLMLYVRRDFEKAVVYFSIACRLAPSNEHYAASLSDARAQASSVSGGLFSRFISALKKKSNTAL